MQRHQARSPFERYADDVIGHCRSEAQARFVLAAIRERFAQCGLTLHPTKTRIVYCKDGRRRGKSEHNRFDFLSHTFQLRGARRRRDGKMFLSFLPAISAVAARAIWQQIRGWDFSSKTHLPLGDLANLTNTVVRGWVAYFGQFYRSECLRVLRQLNKALARWARRQYKRFHGSPRAAERWLGGVARRSPQLFVLWQLGERPAAGR